MGIPQKERNNSVTAYNLKYYVGTAVVRNPEVLVKSDAAGEPLGALTSLGWHTELSLETRWPRNTQHERYHGTLKSVIRASICQAGFPRDGWDWCVPYSSVVLGVTQPAPLAAWEKDEAGNVLPEFKLKSEQSC